MQGVTGEILFNHEGHEDKNTLLPFVLFVSFVVVM